MSVIEGRGSSGAAGAQGLAAVCTAGCLPAAAAAAAATRRHPAFARTHPLSLPPSCCHSLGVTSGFYMFNEPLKKYFEEQAKQLAEQQAAEGGAAPATSAEQQPASSSKA